MQINNTLEEIKITYRINKNNEIIKLKRIKSNTFKPKKLLVLDFDKTITEQHTNENVDWLLAKEDDNEERKKVIKTLINFRNKEELQKIIKDAQDKKIGIAIASFNSRPDCIKSAMELLVPNYADRITIITSEDVLIKTNNLKIALLDCLQDLYEIKEKKEIVLVDDDIKNFFNVLAVSYLGIYAKKGSDDYIEKIKNFINGQEIDQSKLKQEAEKNKPVMFGEDQIKRSISVDNTKFLARRRKRSKIESSDSEIKTLCQDLTIEQSIEMGKKEYC